jgi:flagellar basal-body rod modification protein FlgD
MVINPINNPRPSYALADAAATTAATTSSSSSTASSGLGGTAPSEQMFLQLLVAQIQNQDPTSPQDPSQFVAQLAQFSQLEQVIAIRQDTDSMTASASAAATTSSTTTGATTGA